MVAAFYGFLQSLGYPHPVHPAIAHMPIGLVTGSLVFGVIILLWRRPLFGWSARHCLLLAWLFWFPTTLFGIMDWQYFYAGVWLFAFKIKLILAGILFVLLSIGIFISRNPEKEVVGPLTIYALSFCCVVGLGWYGGNLVFGGRTIPAPKEFKVGMQIFEVNCSGCHPRGGNAIQPNLPLVGSPELEDFHSFQDFIRDPKMPDGSKGVMPDFSKQRISQAQAEQLYQYLINVLSAHKKK